VPYKEKIWDQYPNKWLPILIEEKNNTPELDWWFEIDKGSSYNIFKKKDGKWKEPHLTYRQHYNYLIKNKIYDILEIPNTFNNITKIELDSYDTMKEQSAKYPELVEKISNTEWGLTSRTMGR
jgi:hypothetical protein